MPKVKKNLLSIAKIIAWPFNLSISILVIAHDPAEQFEQ